MRFHEIAEELLAGRIKILLLRTLIKYPTKRFSGRELSRLIAVSPSSALAPLESLRRAGLARKSTIGNTTEWALNRRHVLVSYFSPLVSLDKLLQVVLRNRIRKILAREKNIIKAQLFGSIVRGDERPESDIDLFIVVKEQKDKKAAAAAVDKLNESIISDFGNHISPVIYSQQEAAAKQGLDLLARIRDEGEEILNNE